jgi:LAS superfamily LD-carboxypeptidase LdcB
VLLLVASLALLVPIGLQIHQNVADKAAASQALADQAAADQAAAKQAAADQAAAKQAAADQAAADQAAARQAAAEQAAADQAAAKQAAANRAAAVIKKAEAAQAKSGTGGLEPSLSRAFNEARAAALAAGLDLRVNSGLRSVAEQQRLYDEAIARYGSRAKARRWVLPPAESGHVKGLAIDVGPPAAATWLEKNGVRYGLCRRYVNEWWHFERLAPAIGQRCPALEPYAGG